MFKTKVPYILPGIATDNLLNETTITKWFVAKKEYGLYSLGLLCYWIMTDDLNMLNNMTALTKEQKEFMKPNKRMKIISKANFKGMSTVLDLMNGKITAASAAEAFETLRT